MSAVDLKIRTQRVGHFLSNMIMPNIAAFITWGIITALFIPAGWFPNKTLAGLVNPIITYMLPLLIGYTGGKLVGGARGGVVGVVTTMGAVVGSHNPMFIGAMIAGPLGGYSIKSFDRLIEGKIKSGFEMLVNNFSAGIIGVLLTLLAFVTIGPLVEHISRLLAHGVGMLIQYNILPLISIFIEPSKIFFLNNAINHGIFSPLGIQQTVETGKSLFFLIEANPGPGLGVLLSYALFGRENAKQSALGASVIHFLGGIHEIYFPYVLINPRLMLAVIAGGISSMLTLVMFDAGLLAPPSPGSIFAILVMTPTNSMVGVLAAITVATVVSFIITSVLLRKSNTGDSEGLVVANSPEARQLAISLPTCSLQAPNDFISTKATYSVIVACDAGMGSSAMGAGLLRKKIEAAGLTQVAITHCAIDNLPADADIIITHSTLTQRARRQVPKSMHLSLTNFMDSETYTDLVNRLLTVVQQNTAFASPIMHCSVDPEPICDSSIKQMFQLSAKDIFIGLKAENKQQAIRFAGEQLVKNGYVQPSYTEAMLAREQLTSTYIGESVAVPHGTIEAKEQIIMTGIVICQYPQGVQFGEQPDETARLVIGIAARNDEHVQLLANLTTALNDPEIIEKLATTTEIAEMLLLTTKISP